ncbi:hypothetical protein SAMN05443634_101173 [Chishuiella changwenlii]|uniref:C1q domain-containing protein n=1 Tax=Chishuiella changwenlii TaxID=1434701 RepID=A0A1M6SY41_9FLAO|nr:hypothetical protein [Chishuiella changwenlii]GGF08905.1 hypothetical protein GCM10010984_27550 [Chishuiella changwenlii]SHK49641.1 hypothetical protein SAMN05443634_101173 [Chishuiella changwenlii]
MKRILIPFCIVLSAYAVGQVGVNTSTPEATLDVVTKNITDKVLKLSTVSNNATNRIADINYEKGSPLYIDDNGYVYKAYSPSNLNGVSGVADGNYVLTTAWKTIYTLPHNGSILDFSFFTNFSFGSGGSSLISGKVSVGNGTGINIYTYSSSVLPIKEISNNLTKLTSINFNSGAGLQFQLNGNTLQARLSQPSVNNSFIEIYGSTVTKTQ